MKEAGRREMQFPLCQVEVARVDAGNPVRRWMRSSSKRDGSAWAREAGEKRTV